MRPAERHVDLPEIPRKRYFAIGEVAELCEVKPHVLRYWEQEFPQLKPIKRRGNRRYYQHEDVLMVRRIRSLLYEQGFTIGGARLRLKEMPKITVVQVMPSMPVGIAAAVPVPAAARGVVRRTAEIQNLRSELESLLKLFPS